MDQYVGEIRIFAGTFAPKGWAFCDGSIVPIHNNTPLFSLLGNTYGGDGKTTFALPDLRGRAPMHQGQGPGLTPRPLGSPGGTASVTLLTTEMPVHTHIPACQNTTNGVAEPTNAVWTKTAGRVGPPAYSPSSNQNMNPLAIGVTGSSLPHNNMQPYLAVNFIIALEGSFPPRG
ncbi:phage tail protein [Paenibacillus sp. J22TS3]|uniref:phage tail protein n=1 Tax=Paenibacillus sp. J22TS3 TaxID=2807192 RepID=UPI001B265F54|nr:tail fiber protein [Paenibacillus sp. J22TS3]GIP23436.1 tail Collar domain-containing protein [Paenibacillus sp. J22TS3]